MEILLYVGILLAIAFLAFGDQLKALFSSLFGGSKASAPAPSPAPTPKPDDGPTDKSSK